MGFSKEQIARYSRQLILPEIGVRGQQKLAQASVLVVGAGGLGSPVSLYLAAAGVGHIGIVDSDAVSLSNLHRQILYATDDIGAPKALRAADRLLGLNPEIRIEPIQERVDAATVENLVGRFAYVADGSDNFATRYLVNDACVLLRKPLVYGGVVNFEGQVMAILPRESACFRCVFSEAPKAGEIPSCQEAGVVGAIAGVIGSLMAHEVLKLIMGIGEPLKDRLSIFDGRTSRFREARVRRDLNCALCGESPTITKAQAIDSLAGCIN